MDLKKVPSISETIDWARTLLLLHADRLDPELVRNTMNVILKFQEDIDNVQPEIGTLTAKALLGGLNGPATGDWRATGQSKQAQGRAPSSLAF